MADPNSLPNDDIDVVDGIKPAYVVLTDLISPSEEVKVRGFILHRTDDPGWYAVFDEDERLVDYLQSQRFRTSQALIAHLQGLETRTGSDEQEIRSWRSIQ